MERHDAGERTPYGAAPPMPAVADPAGTGPSTATAPPPASSMSPPPPAAGWRVAVGAVWLLAIFLAYYTVHKPFTPSDLAAVRALPVAAGWDPPRIGSRIGGELLDLLAVAWVMVLAGAIGQALWRAARLGGLASAEARLIGTVLGLGALGLAAFALGLAGLLRAPAAYLLLGVPTVALLRDIVAQARWIVRAARAWWRAGWRAGGGVERLAVLFALLSAALVLLATLLPPTAWDALAYHLPAVRAFARTGHIVLDPNSPQGYQPQLVELLYTLLYLIRGGDSAAQPLHAACGALAVALVARMAWRAAGPRAGVRASALALAIPLVTTVAGWAYVDLPLVAAELAALLALVLWHATRRAGAARQARGWLLMAGACAGVGLDIKYTAAYGLAALALLVAGVAWRLDAAGTQGSHRTATSQSPRWERLLAWGQGARAAVGPVLLFAWVAVAVGCIWPLRNLLLIGDPIFPYHLGTLLPQGPNWDAGRTAFMDSGGWGLAALWRAPLLPLETTLLGQQQSVEFDGTLGPLLLLLLGLAPLTLAAWPRWPRWPRARALSAGTRRAAHADTAEAHGGADGAAVASGGLFWRWPLGYAAVLGVLWSAELACSGVAMQSRLWLSLFVALVVPAAVAWLRLEHVHVPSVSLGRLLAAGVALCLCLTLATQALQTATLDNLAVLAGAQSRQDYLLQQLGPYALAMRQVDALGSGARVLFLWEPRTYLTTAAVAPDAFIDNANYLYRRCGSAVGITACLRARGYTHVLLYREGMEFVRTRPDTKDPPGLWSALDAALASWSVVYRDDVPLAGMGTSTAATSAGWYVLYALPTVR